MMSFKSKSNEVSSLEPPTSRLMEKTFQFKDPMSLILEQLVAKVNIKELYKASRTRFKVVVNVCKSL